MPLHITYVEILKKHIGYITRVEKKHKKEKWADDTQLHNSHEK
jgi:hypothetical protein